MSGCIYSFLFHTNKQLLRIFFEEVIMASIELETAINAPIDRVFDLSRSIDAHQFSTSSSKEKAISGRTSGLINLGENVEWEARHFGITQRLSVTITEFHRPNHFRDEMINGAFSMMAHDHYFENDNGVTQMRDVFKFKAPLGVLGLLAEKIFLIRYMRNFLIERNKILKFLAEGDEWKRFLTQ
jgi:ligand-binding SRPBCC domain-containing protein